MPYCGFCILFTKKHGFSLYHGGWDLANEARDKALTYASKKNLTQTWDNEADAYRHFIWNAMMCREYGSKVADIISRNHEFATWDFVDTDIPNSMTYKIYFSSLMDMHNNRMGIEYASQYKDEYDDLFQLALLCGDLITSLDQVADAYGLNQSQIFSDKSGEYIKVFTDGKEATIVTVSFSRAN